MKTLNQWIIAALMALASLAVHADVVLTTVAEVEKTAVDAEGKQVVTYVPADRVVPGDVVRYTITATNNGQGPADKIVVTNPIPEHMKLVADSVQSSAMGKGTTIEYSVDGGKSWGTLGGLTIRDANGNERPAGAADVTTVRWKLNFPLAAGEKARVWYKAKLD